VKRLILAISMMFTNEAISDEISNVSPDRILDLFDAMNKELASGKLKWSEQRDCIFRVDRASSSVEITYEPKETNIKIGPFVVKGNPTLTSRRLGDDNSSNSRTIYVKATSLDGNTHITLDISSSAFSFPRNDTYIRIFVYEPKLHTDFLGEALGLKGFEHTARMYDCGYYFWDMN
jgi:hypothetical protein